MAPTALTDLPPELLDHITTYIDTANSISNLGRTSKTLASFVEKNAWATFNKTRFPSWFPAESPSPKESARSLTALSRAWDRRAILTRQIEPYGNIHSFPENAKVDKWTRPQGQTIGYTPILDVSEEIGSRWKDRREVLAFSAGAQICLRDKTSDGRKEEVKWTTYRPLSAWEGRDDVTGLHLIRGYDGREDSTHTLIMGTANGDLQLLGLPKTEGTEVDVSYFVTQGTSVRSTSLLSATSNSPSILGANLGDSRIALYPINNEGSKIEPLSEIDTRTSQNNGTSGKNQRIWSTKLLSPQHLATGLGPSQEPIHIYAVTPTGIEPTPVRRFGLADQHENQLDGLVPNTISSVYPIVTLPPASASDSPSGASVFLSGAYDGIIRLHDLRSNRDVEQMYIDPTDDSPIYSLLPRGQEKLVAGSSRHSLLKLFDLRLGAKCYSYIDASSNTADQYTVVDPGLHQADIKGHWNLFVQPSAASRNGGGRGGRGGTTWSRQPRTRESSIYNLAASSPHSPYLYLGLESRVVSLALTGVTDTQPDPVFFSPWRISKNGKGLSNDNYSKYGGSSRDIMDLAMYDQLGDMKLRTQMSVWETLQSRADSKTTVQRQITGLEGLDERWTATT